MIRLPRCELEVLLQTSFRSHMVSLLLRNISQSEAYRVPMGEGQIYLPARSEKKKGTWPSDKTAANP